MNEFRQNTQKFKELILYISESYESMKFSGKTKLNKTLFAIDFDSYIATGKPITGVRYKKAENGPVPFSIMPVIREMVGNGELKFIKEKVGKFPQDKPIPLRKPNLELFTENEMSIVNKWIKDFKEHKGNTLSNWSHDLPFWNYPDEDQFIPYNRAFWGPSRKAPITNSDEERAKIALENIEKEFLD